MKWFLNLKVRVKLLTAFIIMALLTGIVGIIGTININVVDKNYSDLYVNYGVAVGDIGQASIDFQGTRATARDIFLSKDMKEKQNFVIRLKELDKSIEDSLESFRVSLQTEDGKKVYNNLLESLSTYKEVRDKAINLSLNNRNDEAIEVFYGEGTAPANSSIQYINELFELKKSGGLELSEEYGKITDSDVV